MGKTTDKDKIEIVKRYKSGESSMSISKDYNITWQAVIGLLKRRDIYIRKCTDHLRKYPIIYEDFFETINSEKKAYFLGLMYADGYNCEQRGYVSLGLAEHDLIILKTLNNIIQPTKPIYCQYKEGDTHQNYHSIKIYSKKFSKDLAKHGCIQRKTHVLTYPDIDTKWDSHFIRGYFDGDGCIHIPKQEKKRANVGFMLCGTKTFLTQVQQIIIKNIHLNKTKLNINKNTAVLGYYGKCSIVKIKMWLYQDATIYLDRKYQKFQQVYNKTGTVK